MTVSTGAPESSHLSLHGLYLILDQRWASRCSLTDVLRQAAEAGVRLIQYRNKEGSMQEVYRQALELRNLAAEFNMLFIVDDRCDVGVAVEADGVHLGQSDLPIGLARRLIGTKGLIGISTHTQEEVVEATEEGADYLGFGPMFPTTTKADHEPVVGLEGLKNIRSFTSLPIFAIGGIKAESVQDLIAAGADGVAVASAVLDAPNPQLSITQFMESFQ